MNSLRLKAFPVIRQPLMGQNAGPSWRHLGPSWRHLGAIWAHLKPTLAYLYHISAHLGAIIADKTPTIVATCLELIIFDVMKAYLAV